MEVQKHLIVIERGVIKELLKLKNERLFSFTKLFALKRSRAPRSGSSKRYFLECKNSSWAIVNRE